MARNDDYDRLRSGWRRNESGSRPGLGSDVLDLPVGHEWQPGEHVAQVGVRIDAAGAATLDDGVEDGAAFAGIGIAEEEPVFLSKRGGTNGVLDEIIVDFDSTIFEKNAKQ